MEVFSVAAHVVRADLPAGNSVVLEATHGKEEAAWLARGCNGQDEEDAMLVGWSWTQFRFAVWKQDCVVT